MDSCVAALCLPFMAACIQIRAHDDHQRYKEGKFMLERGCLLKDNGWETLEPEDADETSAAGDARRA